MQTTGKLWDFFLKGFPFFLLFFTFFPRQTLSQPWLSNRFAQNCASCHSPGRFNKPLAERRCTLSCQGCHASPSGGGMRSSYGKWTQERWLRSFFIEGLMTNKRKPAPFEKQPYFDERLAKLSKNKNALSNLQPSERKPQLITIPTDDVREGAYGRKHEYFDSIEVSNDVYRSVVPTGDPYHLERMFYVSGGADFRYFILNRSEGFITNGKAFKAFPMAADLYLRFKPVREHISLVTEARFLNGPNNSQLEKFFTNESLVRSAYLLSDHLPYNSYVQAGLYRPLFGYYTADHTTLASTLSGLGVRSVFLAASIGSSPNVPFANFHLIGPRAGGLDIHGFAANLGGRFVTLGASFMFSFWRTTTRTAGVDLVRSMYSATGGLHLGPTTANVELLHVSQEFAPGARNAGDVFTVDTQTRLWRENYFLVNWARSNVARSLLAGSGTEFMIGLKSYLVAGTDLELLFIDRKDTVSSVTSSTKDIQFQIHLFY